MGPWTGAIRRRGSRDGQFRECGKTGRTFGCGLTYRGRYRSGGETMTSLPSPALIALADIAWAAGQIILRHYADEGIESRKKDDQSPVTAADEDAEKFILARLGEFSPGVPIIAEEEAAAGRV